VNQSIVIQNISKHFSDQTALNHINLQINNGEFLTLLGPSGCGKTTLLRLLAGFEQPDSGRIFLNEKDITATPPEQRHINMVFQSYALFPHMNVFENVAFGLRCHQVDSREIKQRVQRSLTTMHIEQFAKRKPSQLSGGQQQRVAVARAIVNQPLVVLLDEPFSALDYQLRKKMRLELKQLQRQLKITFVFVTHDQEEALSLSDRIAVMDHGIIEQVGTPREIYETPCNLHVAEFIGEANIFACTTSPVNKQQFSVTIEDKPFIINQPPHDTAHQRVHIIIRPEDIRVWGKNEVTDTSSMLPGRVEQVIYKGSTVDLVVRLNSGKIIYATEFFDEDDEDLEYDIGEHVWMNWMSGWEVVLNAEQ